MSNVLALVTLDCESQFRELSVSAFAFVFDTLPLVSTLWACRCLALEVVGVRTRVRFGCLSVVASLS